MASRMEIVSIRVLCSISYKTNGTTLLENSQRVFSFHYQYSVFEKFSASTHPFPQVKCAEIKILFVVEALFHLDGVQLHLKDMGE